jgi:acetyltransferase-like isoleucine patch superfamily enzyme
MNRLLHLVHALVGRLRAQAQLRWARVLGLRTGWGKNPSFWRGRISLGGRGSLAIGSWVRIYGAPLPCRLSAAKGASLRIGDWTVINYGAEIYAAESVSIGNDCMIGEMSAIYDTDFHETEEGSGVRTAAIAIGDNVWIGRGAMILPGVSIGDHSIVGAGSIVTADVPPRTVVAGNPARVRRELRAADGWRRP